MKRLVVIGLTLLPALFATMATAADTINAAGATFPAPIYQQWFGEYKMAHPDVQINYQAIGSGGGVRQLQEGTVDFGASDFSLTDEQIKMMLDARKPKPLHFPTVLGAVVMSYNLPGLSMPLKLTGEVIAGIYLGDIKKWNDPKIASMNPGVRLPNEEIQVVHRNESSGTTFIFTDYLSRVSPAWKMKVGNNAAVEWPLGLGARGSDGVEGMIKQTPYSIAYVELTYAVKAKMAFADVKNAAGKFVTPNFRSVTEAASSSKEMPADFRASITNAPGAGAYPISSFTWMLIPSEIKDAQKKKAITGFLAWMLTTGQKDAEGLSYAPLPAAVVAKEKAQIAMIR